MPKIFDPIRVGDLTLSNRLVMAPLTRQRSGSERIPNELMAEYYGQRASAGLILTEATIVSPQGAGYADTPGLWSDAQVEGWRKSVQAVHARGGIIMAQLWHVGRVSDPHFLKGELPVAPSAIAPSGNVSLLRPKRPFVTPRALGLGEIPGIVSDFRRAAENAKRAGFDGVELHAANGYLIDQFLQTKSNQRTDQYGGTIENRARLLLEIVDEFIAVWGAGRVGVHLAPRGDSHDVGDADPKALFGYVARELGRRKVAFLFLREHAAPDSLYAPIREAFGGPVVLNEKLTVETAREAVETGRADLVSFGRLFIANPDLVERLKSGAELNAPNPETFYTPGAVGYTDYPALR